MSRRSPAQSAAIVSAATSQPFPPRSLVERLGSTKFLVVVIMAVVVMLSPFLDIDTGVLTALLGLGGLYIGAEGAADTVSRFKAPELVKESS